MSLISRNYEEWPEKKDSRVCCAAWGELLSRKGKEDVAAVMTRGDCSVCSSFGKFCFV